MLPLRDARTTRGWPWVASAVAVVCVWVYLQQARLGPSLQGFLFNVRYGFIPERLASQPLRASPTLITNLFLHGNLLHLLGNLLFLLVFAGAIEARLGGARFGLFYLAAGVVSNLVYALLSGEPRIPLIGASGAISGLLGAYLVLYPRVRVLAFIPPFLLPWLVLSLFASVPRFFLLWFPAWLFIGYWFVIQLAEAATHGTGPQPGVSGVAWWAHVGGFAFGVVAASLLRRRPPAPLWR